MKKIIAVTPFSDREENNKLFEINNEFRIVKRILTERGYEVITTDLISAENESTICYYFFLLLDYDLLWKLIKKKENRNKLIYFCKEPETVIPEDSIIGLRYLLQIFAYIITPYDNLVDDDRVIKYWGLHEWEKINEFDYPFQERKVLVNISGYKFSNNPKEMYSERIRLIREYEGFEQFDFYGRGDWEELQSSNYKGEVETTFRDKYECYQHYRFALALENSRKLEGYYTEKITDCLRAGIVPIYLPFDGFDECIPANCYINYEHFKDASELWNFISNMPETEWRQYLNNIEEFLCNNKRPEIEIDALYESILKVIDAPVSMDRLSLFAKVHTYVGRKNILSRVIKKALKVTKIYDRL